MFVINQELFFFLISYIHNNQINKRSKYYSGSENIQKLKKKENLPNRYILCICHSQYLVPCEMDVCSHLERYFKVKFKDDLKKVEREILSDSILDDIYIFKRVLEYNIYF